MHIISRATGNTLLSHMHAFSDIGSPLGCYILNYCLSLCLSLQVSVFSPSPRKHYFNITPSNIIRIYATNSGEKTSQAPLVCQLHTSSCKLSVMKYYMYMYKYQTKFKYHAMYLLSYRVYQTYLVLKIQKIVQVNVHNVVP